jgi:hypothetical protein
MYFEIGRVNDPLAVRSIKMSLLVCSFSIRVRCYKTFYNKTSMELQAGAFDLDKHFHPSLTFVSKVVKLVAK